MSIHKLSAGSGYDYLTRQVAALDATEKGHTGLASYYTERGETPGQWVGSGIAGIEGLQVGAEVTAEQMQALFGSGHHPLAAQRLEAAIAEHDAAHRAQGILPQMPPRASRGRPKTPQNATAFTVDQVRAATRLGTPFPVYDGQDISGFRVEVARRICAVNTEAGLPSDTAVPAAQRAQVRTAVAGEMFAAEHGRGVVDARELAGFIAKNSRSAPAAVAGFDLTFSPVKSVSALWAVADQATAARVELAHRAAVEDALAFIENHALFTRIGSGGIRQVGVRGLVATAFTHRDSRAGDPDLHTHVAVANKVQTQDGRWLAIDGRVLFKATVAASEVYNSSLERHLHDSLGVRFAERPSTDLAKRGVREVVGVEAALNDRWSARRAMIEVRRDQLAADFQATHARPPTPVETLQLAQQATLETRDAKHEPRTLGEQRAQWRTQAASVLGSEEAITAMVDRVRASGAGTGPHLGPGWVQQAADQVLDVVQSNRSTWQVWHVYAEAQRQVRTLDDLTAGQVSALVDQVTAAVLEERCVALTAPAEPVQEPAALRRVDGTSVYTVAGATAFTSPQVIAAEERLVAAAGRRDGHRIDAQTVGIALLESTANGVELNAGQADLVGQMATSGARVQLAIAPAGSGKTTAMRALTGAWAEAGGTVIGLAPSAAAAAALRDQIETHTDTLAKLTWSLANDDLPAWAYDIGPFTLVVIDEVGMADTISLDTVVAFVLERGGSVRLVGDDQQLAAIGAGGVLRDICATHGALRLGELLRFTDPAEGAATLALREGRTEALGFYLDHHRIHVGDLAAMTKDVFAGWVADRGQGFDAIMLAPTRELVADLNQRARAHRLAETGSAAQTGATRTLSDSNLASAGEVVITRSNDRRLRTSPTDWVKNGDRWSVTDVHQTGDLSVQDTRNGHIVRLPATYVNEHVELGYASTVHTAQGVSADSMHGLATGEESRQLLYTMMTRGRHANHAYLQVVGDGDPHSVIRPELTRPQSPVEILEAILARDTAPVSASTMLRDQGDPAPRLAVATSRYLDSLYLGAEHVLGTDKVARLDQAAQTIWPGLHDAPAWPALRSHLLLLGAHGLDPTQALAHAAADREVSTAGDVAAVLDWRLDETGMRNTAAGPLPWIPSVPDTIRRDPTWGAYLVGRGELVEQLAARVAAETTAALADHSIGAPVWASPGTPVEDQVLTEVSVWRAAMGVPAEDRRPTGPPVQQKAAARWQRRLNKQAHTDRVPALREWGPLLEQIKPGLCRDDYAPTLADRLSAIARAGLDAPALLSKVGAAPLPDEHAAAAVWWRLHRHLAPAVAAQIDTDKTLSTPWAPQLTQLLGAPVAKQLQASSWWPALVTNVDHAIQRGWTLQALLSHVPGPTPGVDLAQALTWRISLLLDPLPHTDTDTDTDDVRLDIDEIDTAPPADLWEDFEHPDIDPAQVWNDHDWTQLHPTDQDHVDSVLDVDVDEDAEVDGALARAGLRRQAAPAREPDDRDIALMLRRAHEWDHSPVTRDRMLEVNDLAATWFQTQLPGSWSQTHLAERFGQDLTGHDVFRPGHAPAGWTNLVDHLRRHGVTEQEMLATGVASTARTGRLIDRFRDRAVFPITHHGEVLGFVARRHPDLTDADRGGPKYLNTSDTALFHKGAQLFGADDTALDQGAVPVLVEGPMDAIAVTLATAGSHVGLAPLGTALTTEQAAQLATYGPDAVVATDADAAGQVAAERDFWLLAGHGLNPLHAHLPDGADPASLLTAQGPAALAAHLHTATPLAHTMLTERLDHLEADQAARAAIAVLAATRAEVWEPGLDQLARHLDQPTTQLRRELVDAIATWDANPDRATEQGLGDLATLKTRLGQAAQDPTPVPGLDRWAQLARQVDPRLLESPDWAAVVAVLDEAQEQGHDVHAAVQGLVAQRRLGADPGQDLRYRVVAALDLNLTNQPIPATATGATTTRRDQDHPQPTPATSPPGSRRR